jgi:hypothetical protein
MRYCILVVVAVLIHQASFAAPLRVSVSGADVVISSATPRGEILLLGVGETRGRSAITYRTYNIGLTAGSDGEASWHSPKPFEPGAGWVAIDVESGKYATASADKAWQQSELAEVRLKKDNDGHWRNLEPRLAYAEIFLVRPKRGAWHRTAGDGGTSDRDGTVDGKIDVGVDDLEALGRASGKLAKLENDDFILILSAETRSILTRKVTVK